MTVVRPLIAPEHLRGRLTPEAVAALDAMVAEVTDDASRIGRLFAGAARRTRRGPLESDGVEVRAEDAVRVELLAALAAGVDADRLLDELGSLYRFGDSDEKRAVLLALNRLEDGSGIDGSEILLDALRTNDPRLVAAAMGDHARRLSVDAWRQGVLKCLFVGVPVAQVAALGERADAELGAMAERYARERRAAGRDVPDDVATVIDAGTGAPTSEPQPKEA